MRKIRRMVTVIEFEDATGPHAALVVQDGGQGLLVVEEDYLWDFDAFGTLRRRERPYGPRQVDLRTSGPGSVTFFENADDLFAQWRGPQPGRPPVGELADRPAIEPPRKDLP